MKAERENNIIAKIYDAALLPALWLEVIQDIVQYTQSHSAIFTGLDQFNPAYDFVYTYNIPEESLAAYQDERIRVIDMKLHMPLWNKIDMGRHLIRTAVIMQINLEQSSISFMKNALSLQG